MTCDVLYEDNHLLAVNKPAGMATAHEPGCMLDLAREHIRQKYRKPGNVFLGLVQRLDKPVSGVLLFARTSKAAARISQQFRQHQVLKTYLAITEALPRPPHMQGWSYEDHGVMEDWLWHDDAARQVRIVPAAAPDAVSAATEYRVLRDQPPCLLQLSPRTGRKHQLRVQLASRGAPIFGDRKYGSSQRFAPGIALHAWRLAVRHPTRGKSLEIQAEPPLSWCGSFPAVAELLASLPSRAGGTSGNL